MIFRDAMSYKDNDFVYDLRSIAFFVHTCLFMQFCIRLDYTDLKIQNHATEIKRITTLNTLNNRIYYFEVLYKNLE